MHFDNVSSVEGSSVVIILFLPTGKLYKYNFLLNFKCTNNLAQFEALALGLREDLQLGCHHIQTFGDLELVVNMIKGTYRLVKKIFRRYINVISQFIKRL